MILPHHNIKVDTSNFFNGGLELTNKQLQNFDPLVTGYAFIYWVSVPKWLDGGGTAASGNAVGNGVSDGAGGGNAGFSNFKDLTQRNFKSLQGISDIEIDTQAYQYGFANNEYNVAAGITKANTEITLKHQEFSGSPIKNAYQAWASGIRDPETGIATYPAMYGLEYKASNHTGELLYIVTRPDGNTVNYNNIEFAAYFTNVFPTRIPLAHFNYDQGDKSVVEIEIPLKCNMHISAKVDAYAQTVLKKIYSFRTEGLFDPEADDQSHIGKGNPPTGTAYNYAETMPNLEAGDEEE